MWRRLGKRSRAPRNISSQRLNLDRFGACVGKQLGRKWSSDLFGQFNDHARPSSSGRAEGIQELAWDRWMAVVIPRQSRTQWQVLIDCLR